MLLLLKSPFCDIVTWLVFLESRALTLSRELHRESSLESEPQEDPFEDSEVKGRLGRITTSGKKHSDE